MNRSRHGYIVMLSPNLAEHLVSGVFDLHRLDVAVATIERTLPIAATRFTDRLILLHEEASPTNDPVSWKFLSRNSVDSQR